MRAPPPTLGLILAGSLLSGLPAQTLIHVPDAAANAGAINLVPLGGKDRGAFQDMRTQIRVPASFLPTSGGTITDLGFAAGGGGGYGYAEIRVTLAHLKGTTLSSTFADNLAGAVDVLHETGFSYPFPSADAFHRIGLKGTFVHDGKRDLVIDVMIQGAFFNGDTPGSRRSSTLETVYALSYDAKNPVASGYGPFLSGAKLVLVIGGNAVTYFGDGCKSAQGRVPTLNFPLPQLGKVLNVGVSQAPAASGAMFFLGGSDKQWGPVPLPLDLAVLGAPGCKLLVDLFLVVPTATTATGTAGVALPMPSDSALRGTALFGQWAIADSKANALGLVVSGAAKAALQ